MIIFIIGLLLFLEGILIGTDFTEFGVPSLFVLGFHFHHWMMGIILMAIGLGGKK